MLGWKSVDHFFTDGIHDNHLRKISDDTLYHDGRVAQEGESKVTKVPMVNAIQFGQIKLVLLDDIFEVCKCNLHLTFWDKQ